MSKTKLLSALILSQTFGFLVQSAFANSETVYNVEIKGNSHNSLNLRKSISINGKPVLLTVNLNQFEEILGTEVKQSSNSNSHSGGNSNSHSDEKTKKFSYQGEFTLPGVQLLIESKPAIENLVFEDVSANNGHLRYRAYLCSGASGITLTGCVEQAGEFMNGVTQGRFELDYNKSNKVWTVIIKYEYQDANGNLVAIDDDGQPMELVDPSN